MALYIFSDAHLGSKFDGDEKLKISKIESFLDLVRKDGDRLIILGDLFDFWFEYKHAVVKDHFHVLYLLHELSIRGIRIDYVSGNHDFWMGDYFEKQIGVNIHRDSLNIEYADKKLHLIHGDGLASGDVGYRILKRVLRNRLNIWLYRKLPPDWAIPLAKAVSGSSRKNSGNRENSFAPDYENYATKQLDNGYDIVVIAHLHQAVFKKFENGTYINTGDFITHFSYVRIDKDKTELLFIE